MGGERHVEVEDQARKLVLLSNENIDATKKDNLYADILHRGIKENNSTNKKSLKERLKVDLQNRLRNVTMVEANFDRFGAFTVNGYMPLVLTNQYSCCRSS